MSGWPHRFGAIDYERQIAGVDYEPAVCCVCGTDEHTPEQLAECIDSALGPPRCSEGDHPNDDNPGHPMCKTCEDWCVTE